MKRIISIALFALAVLPLVAVAQDPIIKEKNGDTLISQGHTFAAGCKNSTVKTQGATACPQVTLTEGGTLTLTARLAESGDNAQRRVFIRQRSQSDHSIPVLRENTDILIDAGARERYKNFNSFGERAHNSAIQFTNSGGEKWDIPVDVVITAKEDDDAVDDTFILQIPRALDHGYIYGTVTDNDEVALNITDLTNKSLTLTEGGSGTFKVNLDSVPTATVTVDLAQTGTNNPDITFTPNRLTFTTDNDNWKTNQTVTVSAAEDDDAVAEGTVTIKLDASGGNYGDVEDNVTVTVTENDSVGLDISESSLSLDEDGSNKTFDVNLDTEPSATVMVSLTLANVLNGKVTIDKASLTFEPDDWEADAPQTVTVNPEEDDDAADVSGNITITASGGDYAGQTGTVAVTVDDDDTIAMIVSSLETVPEGDNKPFTVRLDSLPTGDVSVDLAQTGTNNSDITFAPDPVTFTTSNWNMNKTVTVTAREDEDALDDSATIRLTASGGGYGNAPTKDVSVTVEDDETADFTVSATTLAIDEGDDGTFMVVLDTQPSATVTVDLAQTGTSNSDVTFTPDPLTFTTSNWRDSQTVTVNAAKDTDAVDESATISLTASGGDYGNLSAKTVTVNVTDTTITLDINPESLKVEVDESSSTTFTVKLGRQPSETATVTLTLPSSTDVTVDTDSTTDGDQNTLTFTTANWSTAQTVTVSAAEDTDSDDDTATITLKAVSGDSENTFTVQVTVDDETPKVVVSESSLSLSEQGSSKTFNVKLKAVAPTLTANVIVRVVSSDSGVTVDTDGSLDDNQSTLTFTPSNWETNQTVTVKAIHDANTVDEDVTLTISARGGASNVYNNAAEEQVTVTVTDDDTPDLTLSGTSLTGRSLTVPEGSSRNFTVQLATQPSGTVTVTLTSSYSDVTLDTDQSQTGNQSTLTFTENDWSSARQVSIAAAHDDEARDETATISVSAAGHEYDNQTDSVSVTVDDDESVGLMVSSSVSVVEGESETFEVSLTSDPTADVTVALAQSGTNNSDVSFTPASLTFTSANWSTGQEITVTAAEDHDASTDAAKIALTASGGGSGVNSYAAVTGEIDVEVRDNDTPGIRIFPSTVSLLEESTTGGHFDVRLITDPSATVTLNLRRSGSSDVSLDTDPNQSGNQTSLIFTSSNWSENQRVRVSAAGDTDPYPDTATITVAATGGDYAGLTEEVTVNVTDNTIDLIIDPRNNRLTVNEDSSSNLSVALSVRPDENVAVSLEQSDPSNPDVRFSPTRLGFTPSNWETPQTVIVYAEKDNDASDDTASVVMEVSGGGSGYETVTRTVNINIPDPDTTGLILSEQSLTVLEGFGTRFTVRLKTDPTANAQVSLEQPSNTDVKVYSGPFNRVSPFDFRSSNWNEPMEVIVITAHDDDSVDDTATITLKASGGGGGDNSYAAIMETISLTVVDDDKPGLLLSPRKSLEVQEGLDAVFRVRLITEPSADVKVTVSQAPDSALTIDTDATIPLSQNTLTFTADDWDTPQPVSVSAAVDTDASDESETISLVASGGGYDTVEIDGVMVPVQASLPVMVKDRDEPGALVSSFGQLSSEPSGAITLNEGDKKQFDVALHSQPTTDIRVTLTSPNPDITFNPREIMFTRSSDSTSTSVSRSNTTPGETPSPTMATSAWDKPVPVTMTIEHDDDPFLETARIVMTASGGNYEKSTVVRYLNIVDDERKDPGPGLARPGDPLTWGASTYAFAIPPVSNGDQATVRLQCKEESEPCEAFFDCTAQNDSRTYRGQWPRMIRPRGADTATLGDIAEIVDERLEKKGRLACIIRSEQKVVAQVWTRSGEGVLVNNSQLIRSRSNEADIGSIPSPSTGDISNIRIRCSKEGGVEDCTGTRLECAEDDGTVHVGHVGAILRGIVRHLQTDELMDLLNHEWEGLGLSCTVFSDQPFTVQILTRTGGGGALVNNSAVSGQ